MFSINLPHISSKMTQLPSVNICNYFHVLKTLACNQNWSSFLVRWKINLNEEKLARCNFWTRFHRRCCGCTGCSWQALWNRILIRSLFRFLLAILLFLFMLSMPTAARFTRSVKHFNSPPFHPRISRRSRFSPLSNALHSFKPRTEKCGFLILFGKNFKNLSTTRIKLWIFYLAQTRECTYRKFFFISFSKGQVSKRLKK